MRAVVLHLRAQILNHRRQSGALQRQQARMEPAQASEHARDLSTSVLGFWEVLGF